MAGRRPKSYARRSTIRKYAIIGAIILAVVTGVLFYYMYNIKPGEDTFTYANGDIVMNDKDPNYRVIVQKGTDGINGVNGANGSGNNGLDGWNGLDGRGMDGINGLDGRGADGVNGLDGQSGTLYDRIESIKNQLIENKGDLEAAGYNVDEMLAYLENIQKQYNAADGDPAKIAELEEMFSNKQKEINDLLGIDESGLTLKERIEQMKQAILDNKDALIAAGINVDEVLKNLENLKNQYSDSIGDPDKMKSIEEYFKENASNLADLLGLSANGQTLASRIDNLIEQIKNNRTILENSGIDTGALIRQLESLKTEYENSIGDAGAIQNLESRFSQLSAQVINVLGSSSGNNTSNNESTTLVSAETMESRIENLKELIYNNKEILEKAGINTQTLIKELETLVEKLERDPTNTELIKQIEEKYKEIQNTVYSVPNLSASADETRIAALEEQLRQVQESTTNIVNGRDGQNGTNGANGTNGTNGTNGMNGSDGQNGTNGRDGQNGTSGSDGNNGSNGLNGNDGTNGNNGSNGNNGNNGNNGSNGGNAAEIAEMESKIIALENQLLEVQNTTTTIIQQQGRDGRDGTNGQDGRDGTDGSSGTNGTDGNNSEYLTTNDMQSYKDEIQQMIAESNSNVSQTVTDAINDAKRDIADASNNATQQVADSESRTNTRIDTATDRINTSMQNERRTTNDQLNTLDSSVVSYINAADKHLKVDVIENITISASSWTLSGGKYTYTMPKNDYFKNATTCQVNYSGDLSSYDFVMSYYLDPVNGTLRFTMEQGNAQTVTIGSIIVYHNDTDIDSYSNAHS